MYGQQIQNNLILKELVIFTYMRASRLEMLISTPEIWARLKFLWQTDGLTDRQTDEWVLMSVPLSREAGDNNILAYFSNGYPSLSLISEMNTILITLWPRMVGWSCLTLRGYWYLVSCMLNITLWNRTSSSMSSQNLSTWNPLQNRTVTPSRRTYWCRYFSCESPTKRQSFSFRLILTKYSILDLDLYVKESVPRQTKIFSTITTNTCK